MKMDKSKWPYPFIASNAKNRNPPKRKESPLLSTRPYGAIYFRE